jgi:thiol-disulfide isomerase/thioredoxin
MRKMMIITLGTLCLTMACRNKEIPPEIKGNWLNATDSIAWVYSFQPEFAVVENSFWDYHSVSKSNTTIRLVLKNEGQRKKIQVDIVDSTTLMIAVKGQPPIKYTSRKAIQPDFRNYDTTLFTEPILKDDSATIIGFIEDYCPKLYAEKGTLYHYNIFTASDDASTEFKIGPDGRFFSRIRIYHPQNVVLIIAGSTQTQLFIVPGERLTICLNNRLEKGTHDSQKWDDYSDWDINHYMGPAGMLSEELILLWDYYYYKRKPEPITKRNNMSLMRQLEYIEWRLNTYKSELESIDSLASLRNHSAKAIQVMHLTAYYEMQRHAYEYQIIDGRIKSLGLRYVHKIPEADPDSELGLLVRDYMMYLNYLGILQQLQIVAGLDQQVKIRLMNYLAGITNDEEDLKRIRTWLAEYEDHKWADFTIMCDYDDKSYDSLLRITHRKYSQTASDILVKYRDLQTDSVIIGTRLQQFDFFLSKFDYSLKGQLICLQILIRMLEQDFLKPEFLDWANNNITHPFLKKIFHEKSQSKTEAPVLFSEYSAETHFIDPGSLTDTVDFFEEILNRFRGKVIFIDFWADWCAPCLAEFEPAEKLKKEFEGKGVVFLYLGYNCRKERWENVIMQRQVGGYHYWLNSEQGNILKERFEIRGIPHYLLFDKSGQQVGGEIPKPSNRVVIQGKLDSLLSI